MKAPDFRYVRPETLQDALRHLQDDMVDAAVIAGGQSLMPMMNFRLAAPDLLVDLNAVEGLDGIAVDGDTVRIGAMTRYSDLEASDTVAEQLPLLAMALPHIAHAAIRNRGTIGGSTALADPAAEMPALLLALGGTVTAASPEGKRDIPADDFFLGLYETALEPGEIVTRITLPAAQPGDRFGFHELARRHGDYAMAGVAVAWPSDGPKIAFFSVADRAVRARAAEDVLRAAPDAIDTAVDALSEIEFAEDGNAGIDTKAYLAGVVLRRALRGMTP